MTLRFELHRKRDTTGVSGTGHIASGVRFSDGTCVLRRCANIANTVTYSCMEDVRKVHCHNGDTKVTWKYSARGKNRYALRIFLENGVVTGFEDKR